MDADGADIIWNQFILGAALARIARPLLERDEDEIRFCYADTHSGSGRVPAPHCLDRVLARRGEFSSSAWFDALGAGSHHPGSWVLAARVAGALRKLAFEADINDLDGAVIEAAKGHREGGWTRFWSHDWFTFLRNRLAMEPRPNFVFIDPPPDDPRGPGYAMDAAILLDTLGIPYLVTYSARSETSPPQDAIDEIGRSGLELHGAGMGRGVLLGGGAETVVLDILTDLRHLAGLLGGELLVRLPRAIGDDYCI
ncbi:MAG: hypothetical protein HY055_15055 [Magnetospirillum sp.]|nr:hypothetical protein [Magnetospirillum sp.]